jgi:aquaporin Z
MQREQYILNEEAQAGNMPEGKYRTSPHRRIQLWQRLLAEFVGTFALILVAAGGDVIAVVSHGEVSPAARVVAPALLVMTMIYTIGNISGAHLNPVVTLAFALRQDFPWRWVPGYWLTQCIGALIAALLLRLLFGLAGYVGATLPHDGILASLVMECLLTFLLVTVILATAANAKLVGHNAGLAVGGTIALCGLFAGPISGASMNPARSLGPALISGELTTLWIYFVGPLVGTLLAVGLAWLLRGKTNPYAMQAARGEE